MALPSALLKAPGDVTESSESGSLGPRGGAIPQRLFNADGRIAIYNNGFTMPTVAVDVAPITPAAFRAHDFWPSTYLLPSAFPAVPVVACSFAMFCCAVFNVEEWAIQYFKFWALWRTIHVGFFELACYFVLRMRSWVINCIEIRQVARYKSSTYYIFLLECVQYVQRQAEIWLETQVQ